MGNFLNSCAKIDASFRSHPTSGISKSSINKDGSFSKAQILPKAKTEGEILSSQNLKVFTFTELKNATRNFRPASILGEGGFGLVYKGCIDDQNLTPVETGSGMTVAIKKLKPGGFQGHKEWLAEVNFLGRLHHPNLVKLIGFCLDGEQMLLVYEFMPKGSLENRLFRCGPKGPKPLSWTTRIKVAIGAARGLSFLHNAAVIFRDFKTSNILLDAGRTTGDSTHVLTQVMGTEGYAAPEYVATGHLSTRCDVYGFGVVLLELLSGKPAIDWSRPGIEKSLVNWAKPYLGKRRKLFRIMDTQLEGQHRRPP